jgi:hypothetical protein
MTAKQFRPADCRLKSYRRRKASALLCAIRRILVLRTPEEEIRQKFLLFLMQNSRVPQGMLEAEEAMAHYRRRARGRADIVGFAPDANNPGEKGEALFVAECKAPGIALTDDVFEQAEEYADELGVYIIILTNGAESECYVWDEEKEEWRDTKHLPNYREMLNPDGIDCRAAARPPWRRPLFDKLRAPQTIRELQKDGHIGADTAKSLYPFLANLAGLFYDESSSLPLPLKHGGFTITESGVRYASYGNAGGGKWDGDYRYFILNDENGDDQIVSFGVFGSMRTKNDPHWGNRKGYTYLTVAIDDFENRHNSLQLQLDKHADLQNDKARIWHDGALTAGKGGAAKRKDVIEFIARRAPRLCKNSAVELGVLPLSRLIDWKCARGFVLGLIEYALLRDKFRDDKKRSGR